LASKQIKFTVQELNQISGKDKAIYNHYQAMRNQADIGEFDNRLYPEDVRYIGLLNSRY